MTASTATPPTTPPATAPAEIPEEKLELFPDDPVVLFVDAEESGMIATMFCWALGTQLHCETEKFPRS